MTAAFSLTRDSHLSGVGLLTGAAIDRLELVVDVWRVGLIAPKPGETLVWSTVLSLEGPVRKAVELDLARWPAGEVVDQGSDLGIGHVCFAIHGLREPEVQLTSDSAVVEVQGRATRIGQLGTSEGQLAAHSGPGKIDAAHYVDAVQVHVLCG